MFDRGTHLQTETRNNSLKLLFAIALVVSACKGPAGADGMNGASGATGMNGANGATGSAGMNGASGATGANGMNGANGATGANGMNGTSGVTGATGPYGEIYGGPTPYLLDGGSQYTITAIGGAGTAGDGGNGGSLGVQSANFADLDLLSTGSVDTSFTLPEGISAPDLGSNPLLVTTSVSLAPNALDQLMGTTNSSMPATGISVAAGVTLTLLANAGGSSPATSTHVTVPTSIVVNGTILAARADSTTFGDMASLNALSLSFQFDENFITGPTSSILAAGSDATGSANGGNGGTVSISNEGGALVLQGAIDAHGGAGASGGSGGAVNLSSGNFGVWNTGRITSTGGAGSTGGGGGGGRISVRSSAGGLFNSGNMSTAGGNGVTSGGGAGTLQLEAYNVGALVNSGTLTFSGGNSTAGTGGSGGSFSAQIRGGTTRLSGGLLGAGGTGGGAGSTGGAGGSVSVESENTNGLTDASNAGATYIGANINVNGGTGPSGGAAGSIYFDAYVNQGQGVPGAYPFLMVGYSSINLSGGDGTVNGGSGGYNTNQQSQLEGYNNFLNNGEGSWSDGDRYGTGSVINQVPWTIRGGNGGTGTGGSGGNLELSTYDSSGLEPAQRQLSNTAAIDLSGGTATGGTTGGAGGAGAPSLLDLTDNGAGIIINGWSTSSTGNLSAAGGGGTTGGGNGGPIGIFSTESTSTVHGMLSSPGGTAGAAAGDIPGTAGSIEVDGVYEALTSGAITFP